MRHLAVPLLREHGAVDDLAGRRSATQYGGFYDWVANTASVDGKWYSVPVGTSSSAFAYRISYFEEAGIADPQNNFPETWEELFAVGKTLKEMGKPFGQALGHSPGDPPSFAYPYMWAYGAMEVEEDGTTVAFNKPEFVEGMKTFIQAWKDAYDETGLSWDDGANNRAFLSDQLCATFNGSSIYIAAEKPPRAASRRRLRGRRRSGRHLPRRYPAGPAGRFNLLGSRSYGRDEATPRTRRRRRRCSSYWLRAGAVHRPGWRRRRDTSSRWRRATPISRSTPPTRRWPRTWTWSNYGRNKGYAGPANQKAAQASARYIVVDTFAKAIQTGDAAGADRSRRGASSSASTAASDSHEPWLPSDGQQRPCRRPRSPHPLRLVSHGAAMSVSHRR